MTYSLQLANKGSWFLQSIFNPLCTQNGVALQKKHDFLENPIMCLLKTSSTLRWIALLKRRPITPTTESILQLLLVVETQVSCDSVEVEEQQMWIEEVVGMVDRRRHIPKSLVTTTKITTPLKPQNSHKPNLNFT